jgi:hypothetical protein
MFVFLQHVCVPKLCLYIYDVLHTVSMIALRYYVCVEF